MSVGGSFQRTARGKFLLFLFQRTFVSVMHATAGLSLLSLVLLLKDPVRVDLALLESLELVMKNLAQRLIFSADCIVASRWGYLLS